MREYDLIQAEQDLEKGKMVDIVKLSEAAENEKQDTSQQIPSGFSDLDDCMDGGFREGDFTIVTGVPGDGKTSLCRMFTLHFAQNETPSLWFTHEMTNREQWDAFEKMGADPSLLTFVPVELEDDFDWMLNHIDKGISEHGTKAVFIDTLGDVVKSVKNQQELSNYATYLAQMCKDLRQFAVKRNIMIFAVAHAVKNTRKRTNETENADIANSNGIPAAATNIFHIWRDEESDNLSYVKIGKSRRDGSKKNWKFRFRFTEGKLLPEGRQTDFDNEEAWRDNF